MIVWVCVRWEGGVKPGGGVTMKECQGCGAGGRRGAWPPDTRRDSYVVVEPPMAEPFSAVVFLLFSFLIKQQ